MFWKSKYCSNSFVIKFISFFDIIAFVIFAIIKGFNKAKEIAEAKLLKAKEEEEAAEEAAEEPAEEAAEEETTEEEE